MTNPLIWIALLGGGLYLITRKGTPAHAANQPAQPGTPVETKPKELVSKEGIKAKFLSNMGVFKAAFEAANKFPFANEAVALKSLEGEDDRARAVAMAEFAKTATETEDKILSTAAQNLALDYRDMFTLSNRGAKADKLIEETITFVKNKLDPAKAQPLDKAFVDLVVDSPMIAVVGKPVASVDINPQSLIVDAASANDNDYDATVFEVLPLAAGQSKPETKEAGPAKVSVNADYQLDSFSIPPTDAAKTKTLAYIGRVVSGDQKFGKYIMTFAPAPKA